MTEQVIASLTVFAPEVFLFLAACTLLMIGAFSKEKSVSVIVAMSAVSVAITLYFIADLRDRQTLSVFSGLFVINDYVTFAHMLICIASFTILIISRQWLEENAPFFEYPVLVLLSTLGMLLLVSANDLMAFYVSLELMSLPLYVLASIRRDNVLSSEAGLKYFTLGSLASGMMLFGASLVYGFSGTTNFDQLSELFSSYATVSPGIIVGMVMIIVALCFKVSAAPFHMWTPDVYQGAPTPVTAFFASAPKIAGMVLFVRLIGDSFAPLVLQWQSIIILVSILTMAIGAFGALMQNNIKRLLAYSSIGHVGYMLVGLAAGNEAGAQSILVYLTLYIFMTIGIFGCLLMLKRDGEYVEAIDTFSGLSQRRPMLAAAIAILLFSMAGIPPLAGFFGKMYVFIAAIEAKLYILAVIGVLTSVISAYYYIRIVKIMYFDESTQRFDANATPGSVGYVVAGCVCVTLFFFIAPSRLVHSAAHAAEALFM